MKKLSSFLILSVIIFGGTTASGQYQIRDTVSINEYLQLLRNADKGTNDRNWKTACTQWEMVTTLNPTVGEYWYRLGESYYNNDQLDKAVEAFRNCIRIGSFSPFEPFDCAYFIAECYAKKSDKKNALDWLQKAFDLGYRNMMFIRRDSSFVNYFNEARFKNIIGLPEKEFNSREDGWRFDLRLVAREVKRRGPNPYRKVSEKQFDSAVRMLNDQIPTLTDIQIIIGFMKIMTLVSDGHTLIYGFFERPEFQQNLPLEFDKFEEGIFITNADKRYEELVGGQVIAMDERPVFEILNKMDPILNRDNERGPNVLGLMRIRTLPLLYGLGLIKKSDEATISVKLQDGTLRKVSIKADCPIPTRKLWDQFPENWISYHQKNKLELPLFMKNRYVHYWFNYFASQKTVYFQYNAMADDPGNSFRKFCDSLFSFIDNTDVEKFIIDLRWNNGGNTMLAPYLLDKVIACKKINQSGRFFGVIGTRVYSATINLCGYLERFTHITYIGEPTGSSPNFIGEDEPFELPYSKLIANVSDRYWQSSWPDNHSQWFSPLVYVPTTFRDFATNKDRSLDLILDYKKLPKPVN